MADALVRFSRTGLVVSATDADIERLREQFEREHVIRFRGLLDAEHVALVQRYLDEGDFAPREHPGIGTELCLRDGRAVRLLFFFANDPDLWDVIQRVTGCARIGCFTGRVYRIDPAGGDYDTWHTDARQTRMIGMSLNLGRAPYQGGCFQLRDRATRAMLGEAPNVTPGDAIVFRIDDALEHWITPLAGTAPKIAFAGWFRTEPDFLALRGADPNLTAVEPEW